MHEPIDSTRWAASWLHGLFGVLQLTGSIITGRKLSYSLSNLGQNIPAASGDSEVFFNSDLYGVNEVMSHRSMRTLDSLIMTLRGLSYHELCHVMWTPSPHSNFAQKLRRTGMFSTFNLIEDQRIEALFCHKYSNASSYFRFITSRLILSRHADGGDKDMLYFLIAGRTYLPRKIRRKARAQAIASHGFAKVREFEELLFEFLSVRLPREELKAMSIIEKIHNLFYDRHPDQTWPASCEACDKGGAQDGISQTDPAEIEASADEVKSEIEETASEQEAADSNEPSSSESNESASAESDDNSGNEDAGLQTDSDGNADSDQSATSSSSEDGDGESINIDSASDEKTGNSGTGSSAGDSKTSESSDTSILDMLLDTIDDALNEASSDLSEIASNVAASMGKPREINRKEWPSDISMVSQKMRTTSNLVVRHFAELRDALSPEWHKGENSGRLNVQRMLLARERVDMNIFNRWDEGSEDEASLEIALLLDASGSMAHQAKQLGETIWVLQDALWRSDIPYMIGIYTDARYDGGAAILPSTKPKPDSFMIPRCTGSTMPGPLIEQVTQKLVRSEATQRVLLMMTDGQWSQGKYGLMGSGVDSITQPGFQSDDAIAAARKAGIYTGMLGFGHATSHYGLHGADFGMDIESLGDIVTTVQKLVREISQRAFLAA